jgi:hypothetical protein
MITTIFLYIISFIFGTIGDIMLTIAGNFSIWPAGVLSGLTYFCTQLMNWNFLLNIKELLSMLKFMVGFDIIYVGIRLLLKLFNYIRGAGPLDI